MSALLFIPTQVLLYYLSSHFIFKKFFNDSHSSRLFPISIIFNLTLAVSATLFLQIICEILGLFSSSLLLWKTNLWLLMALVSAAIPFFLLKSTTSKTLPLALLFSTYLFLFWRLGGVSQCLPDASWLSKIVSRAGIIGVTLMAVISGYGSVLTPMQLFLRRKRSGVMEGDMLQSYHERFQAATTQLQERRSQVQCKNDDDRSWLMKRIGWSSTQQEELADLEMAVEAMTDEYDRLKTEQNQLLFEKTTTGKIWNALNHLLAVYSLYRLLSAALNILLGRAGEADPVSILSGLLVHWDVRLWAKEISFLFVGGVIISSGRNLFQEMIKLSSSIKSSIKSPASLESPSPNTQNILPLATALAVGLYSCSTLLMLRLNLPPSARPLVSEALRGIGFDFFERCFDFMYLASAGVTGLYLYMTRG